MPFGVRRFSKKNTAAPTAPQQQQQTPQSLEEARDEAHSHVISELEQVIEKDTSRNSMDASVASKSNNAAARRASSGLAAEMVETESVGSRFSNRYDEDLEMGSPSPGRSRRAPNGSQRYSARRMSRGPRDGASIASRQSHYYGESDDDSFVDEEDISPRRSSARRYSRGGEGMPPLPPPAHDVVAGKRNKGQEQADCCSGLKTCVRVTYDILRSVPLLTLLWAGGAIAACNLGVQRVQTVGATVDMMGNHFSGLFQYMGYGLFYLDAVNAAIAGLAILFTGATLEILVRKFCGSNGIGGCLKRLSVRSVQAFFFPLAYVGFLAALALLLLTILLASLVLMANQACTAGNTVGAPQAAAELSSQVNTVITWAALKKVTISGADLTGYCSADHGFSTWFWRMTLIYVGAATILQANLAVSAWTIFLNTGHQMALTQAKAAAAMPARPKSMSKAANRPHSVSVSRAEAKEMDYYEQY